MENFDTNKISYEEFKKYVRHISSLIILGHIDNYLHPFILFLNSIKIKFPEAEEIINIVKNYSLDLKISNDIELQLPYSLVPEVAKATGILNRISFISFITHKNLSLEDARENLKIIFIDIKNFREADRVRARFDKKGVDLNMNKIANKFLYKIECTNSYLKNNYSPDALVIGCRYSPDELCLAMLNIPDSSLRQIIYSEIINEDDGLKSVVGYYLDEFTDRTFLKKIDIKIECEEISIPNDPIQSTVFWEHFNKGLILNIDQINLIQNTHLVKIPTLYSSSTLNDKENLYKQIEEINQKNPELSYVCGLILSLQEKINLFPTSSISKDELIIKWIQYAKEIIYDRIFGNNVVGLKNLYDLLEQDLVGRVYVKDLKGLKEFNAYSSVTFGDQSIFGLWETIQNIITGRTDNSLKDESEKVIYIRRGSMFMIVEKSNTPLSYTKRKLINEVEYIHLREDDRPYLFPIASYNKAPEYNHLTEQESYRYVESLIINTNKIWYQRVITYLHSDSSMFSPLNKIILSSPDFFHPVNFLSKYFYYLFFNGKYRFERCQSLLHALRDEIEALYIKRNALIKTGNSSDYEVQAEIIIYNQNIKQLNELIINVRELAFTND